MYFEAKRRWKRGDVISLGLPMDVRTLESHPRVIDNYGLVAVVRGPLVYCIEDVDHSGVDLFEVAVPRQADFEVRHDPEFLGGVTVLRTNGERLTGRATDGGLYRVAHSDANRQTEEVPVTAIPYYAWGNRGAGAMQVWIPAT
jgi:hypothetical protein